MDMATQTLSLIKGSDGYWRSFWVDDSGTRRSKSFGRLERKARTRFARFHAEWQDKPQLRNPEAVEHLTVREGWERFEQHAAAYYRHADGQPTGHADNFTYALAPVLERFGDLPAAEFGPLALQQVRAAMVEDDLCRSLINQRVHQIVQVWRWLVAQQLVPATVWQALRAVDCLRAGRAEPGQAAARESEPVLPVPQAYIDQVVAAATPTLAAMVQVQFYTAMRPGELCNLRRADLVRTGSVWRYLPQGHGARKVAHHGIRRIILLGPQAQAALEPYLGRELRAWCFSPLTAVRERYAACATHRHQDVEQPATGRTIGDHYTTNTYAQAIRHVCRRIGIPEWSPNRLRHSALTRLEDLYGIELARVIAGHTTAATTELYVQRDLAKASGAIEQVG